MSIYENPQHGLPPWDEYRGRVARLILQRGMTVRAAEIVIDAAMYGKGCTEGVVRDRIQKELEANDESKRESDSGTVQSKP